MYQVRIFLGLCSYCCICCLLFLFSQSPAWSSALSDLSNTLNPGQLVTAPIGPSPSFSLDRGNQIFGFSTEGHWDPVSKKIYYLGAGHGNPWVMLIYDAESNSWSEGPVPFSTGGHTYDDTTIDFHQGIIYFFTHDKKMYAYSIAGNTWQEISQQGPLPKTLHGMALEYFPEMNALIHVFAGTVSKFDLNSRRWSQVASNLTMGQYHHLAEYDPVNKVVLFGGGNIWINHNDVRDSYELYTIDSNGKVLRKQNAPVPIGIEDGLLVSDRVSGDFIYRTSNTLYSYNAVTDTWLQIATGNYGKHQDAVAITNSTYGLIEFIDWRTTDALVYKHAQGVGVNVPPPLNEVKLQRTRIGSIDIYTLLIIILFLIFKYFRSTS